MRETARGNGPAEDRNRAPGRFHHDRIGPAGLDNPGDLKGKALSALRRLQKLPDVVQGFFRSPDLTYIHA